MLVDVIDLRVTGNHSLWLRFDDGTEGDVDLAPILSFKGVFEPLRDPAYFASVRIERDLGTIVWPNGADIAPERLHEAVLKKGPATHAA